MLSKWNYSIENKLTEDQLAAQPHVCKSLPGRLTNR